MSRPLRLRFVLPRLEPVTAVGCEVMAAGLARRLARRGHRVEILTTCARDDLTWKNHYAPGVYDREGVTVRRFPVDPGRVTRRSIELDRRLAAGGDLSIDEQAAWLAGRGASAALAAHVAWVRSHTDCFVFAPALCGTTTGAIGAAGGRAALIPALAETPAARLSATAGLLRRAAALLAVSAPEAALIESAAAPPPGALHVVGAGVDPAPSYDPAGFRARHGIETPFLAFAGRRTAAKGVGRLVAHVRALHREGVDLRLVLMGSGHVELDEAARDTVLDLGFLGEQEKADGLAAALALCQPAAAERHARAPRESWLAGRPVLADARGGVTTGLCRRYSGGLWYESGREFAEEVRLLLERGETAAALGACGRRRILERDGWEGLVREAEGIFLEVAARPRTEGRA